MGVNKNIIEGNTNIALFDGFNLTRHNRFTHKSFLYEEHELLYHKSWEWLMSIVEKLESLELKYHEEDVKPQETKTFSLKINIVGNKCHITDNMGLDTINISTESNTENGKINATWEAVVEALTYIKLSN